MVPRVFLAASINQDDTVGAAQGKWLPQRGQLKKKIILSKLTRLGVSLA